MSKLFAGAPYNASTDLPGDVQYAHSLMIHARRTLALCLFALTSQQALAQTPDAGTLLRQQPKPPEVAPAPASPLLPVAPSAEKEKDSGPKVTVKSFRFEGAVLVAKDDLSAALQPFVGKELSFRQLQSLAPLLVVYYLERGYLARVVLPPQEIKDGVVTFQIIEGKRGSLNVTPEGERIDSARVKRLIEARMSTGAPMNLASLGEAMAILNEQPGVNAKVAMVPGKGEGEIDLKVSAAATPLVAGSVGANNQGSRSIGELQVQGTLTLSNPTGHFDAASLLVNATDGSTFARADYSTAVGDNGLRLGGNASHLSYKVVQAGLTALGSHGTANTAGLMVSYPLARRTDFNLGLTGAYDAKKFIDLTNAGETGNRRVRVANLGVNGFVMPKPDSLIGGGVTSFGASLSLGDSHQLNAGALATDSTTRKVEGGFTKLSYNLGHIRSLSQDWSLNTALRGQFADKNLDSAERFSLGGASGVRAYPVSEATGDEGWLLNLNVRRAINDSLAATIFFDAGGITVNHTPWANWNAGSPRLTNRYELYGAGIGLDWRFAPNALLNASLAAPIGNNAGRDAQNNNSDGRSNGPRAWLNLIAQF
jgi:hemolysin activation/secretion protein